MAARPSTFHVAPPASARMTTSHEDDYLTGIIDAAYLGGWLVHHDRRADLAVTQGHPGFPDVVAAHAERGLAIAWELKDRGDVTLAQAMWQRAFANAGVDTRVVRPQDYASCVEHLLGGRALTPLRRTVRRP
jgi:hypothetical protein